MSIILKFRRCKAYFLCMLFLYARREITCSRIKSEKNVFKVKRRWIDENPRLSRFPQKFYYIIIAFTKRCGRVITRLLVLGNRMAMNDKKSLTYPNETIIPCQRRANWQPRKHTAISHSSRFG